MVTSVNVQVCPPMSFYLGKMVLDSLFDGLEWCRWFDSGSSHLTDNEEVMTKGAAQSG